MNLPTTTTTNENQIIDVDYALQEWDAYQRLCKDLLTDSDYQVYTKKEKGKTITKRFPKKSAWFKLGRAFNVNTQIIDKEFVLTKTGETKEAYYCIRATLPNGRTVESDGSCSRHEKGKENSTSHTIRSTAKTRATNRAISELIGAGEVSAEELDSSFGNENFNEVIEVEAEPKFQTAKELKTEEEEEVEEDPDKVYRTAGDVLNYAIRLSDNTSQDILKTIGKLHAPNDLKQTAREMLIQASVMIKKFDTILTCKEICKIIQYGLNHKGMKRTCENYYRCVNTYFKKGLVDEKTSQAILEYLRQCDTNKEGELIL